MIPFQAASAGAITVAAIAYVVQMHRIFTDRVRESLDHDDRMIERMRAMQDELGNQRAEVYNPRPVQAVSVNEIMDSTGPATGTPIEAEEDEVWPSGLTATELAHARRHEPYTGTFIGSDGRRYPIDMHDLEAKVEASHRAFEETKAKVEAEREECDRDGHVLELGNPYCCVCQGDQHQSFLDGLASRPEVKRKPARDAVLDEFLREGAAGPDHPIQLTESWFTRWRRRRRGIMVKPTWGYRLRWRIFGPERWDRYINRLINKGRW